MTFHFSTFTQKLAKEHLNYLIPGVWGKLYTTLLTNCHVSLLFQSVVLLDLSAKV